MTAYTRFFLPSQEGQLADCTVTRVDTEHMKLSSVTELAFGKPVTNVNATDGRGLVPWTTSVSGSGYSGRVFGITVQDPDLYEGKYVGEVPVSVLTLGRIHVYTKNGVSIGDKAYVEEGTGLFTNVATNADSEANTEIGVWMSGTGNISVPTLATISINLEVMTKS